MNGMQAAFGCALKKEKAFQEAGFTMNHNFVFLLKAVLVIEQIQSIIIFMSPFSFNELKSILKAYDASCIKFHWSKQVLAASSVQDIPSSAPVFLQRAEHQNSFKTVRFYRWGFTYTTGWACCFSEKVACYIQDGSEQFQRSSTNVWSFSKSLCSYCQRAGHKSDGCWKKERDVQVCKFCRKWKHLQRNCRARIKKYSSVLKKSLNVRLMF